jgi:hypothetical protein
MVFEKKVRLKTKMADVDTPMMHRYWTPIEELDGRFLRVVTLDDQVTIHNSFPDRGFKP